MQMLSGGILAVSQGIMIVHTGADFLRSKQGNHNSYNADDSVNGVRWELKKQNREVFEFYKGVIAIRKAHPMFRLATAKEVRARLTFQNDDVPVPQAIKFTLNGEGLEGETWSEACVIINPTAEPISTGISEGPNWQIHVLDARASLESLDEARESIELPPHSMAILARHASAPVITPVE
jgi:pullulanase